MKNPWSLEAFADWAEKQEGEYEYVDPWNCACAQYAKALGMDAGSAPVTGCRRIPEWRVARANGSRFWREADDIANNEQKAFPALAQRLRAAIAETV